MQYSDFLIKISIHTYSDNLYTMVGYTVQTGDSGEEGMTKGAINTKRNRTDQAADVAADDIETGFKTTKDHDGTCLYQISMHFCIEPKF